MSYLKCEKLLKERRIFPSNFRKLKGYVDGDNINHLYGLRLLRECTPENFERGDLVLLAIGYTSSSYKRAGHLWNTDDPFLIEVRDVVNNFIIDSDGNDHDVDLTDRFAVIENDVNYRYFEFEGRIRFLAHRIQCLYNMIDDVDGFRSLGICITTGGINDLIGKLGDVGYHGDYIFKEVCAGNVHDVRYFLTGQLLNLYTLLLKEISAQYELYEVLHKGDMEQRDYLDGLIHNIKEIYGPVGHNDKDKLRERIIKMNECTGLTVGIKGSPNGWAPDSYSGSELLDNYEKKFNFIVDRLNSRVDFTDCFSMDKISKDFDEVCEDFGKLHGLKICECDRFKELDDNKDKPRNIVIRNNDNSKIDE